MTSPGVYAVPPARYIMSYSNTLAEKLKEGSDTTVENIVTFSNKINRDVTFRHKLVFSPCAEGIRLTVSREE